MRIVSWLGFLGLSVLLAGCTDHDCYTIEITPEGEAFQRKLTCWHQTDGDKPRVAAVSAGKVAALGKLYSHRETLKGTKKEVFSGRFQGQIPKDLGGAGSYTRFSSSLGMLSIYVERLRGNDDPSAVLARRYAAVDQIVDLLVGWFQKEMGDSGDFQRLRPFLAVDLRRDLKNLSLYCWQATVPNGEGGGPGSLLARAGQYLVERGYFNVKDLPAIVRVWECDSAERLYALLQRLLARKMGVPDDQPIPQSLAFLGDPKRANRSLGEYAPTSEVFRKRHPGARKDDLFPSDPTGPEPDRLQFLFELGEEAFFHFDLFSNEDQVEVRLACPDQPFSTNGKWDPQKKTVSWSARLFEHERTPMLCFASWSTPNQAAQEKHFGRVILRGEELSRYVLWYRGLSGEEARQWDQFLAGLKPDGKLKESVEAFRFASTAKPVSRQPEHSLEVLARVPQELILEALNKAN